MRLEVVGTREKVYIYVKLLFFAEVTNRRTYAVIISINHMVVYEAC